MAVSNPDGDLPSSLQQQESAERRRLLLKYVKDVQPALIEQFVEAGPPAVVAAMKNTITNMLGTLPPSFFSVTISTVAENLSQLMLSVCMTGYMFRNAQYRLELHSALGTRPAAAAAAAGPALRGGGPYGSGAVPAGGAGMQRSQSAPLQGSVLDQEAYAPGVQKSRVQGDVLLWHKENGLETLEAVAYIEMLEGEVARLRQQLDQQQQQPQLPQALQLQPQPPPPLLPQQLQQQAVQQQTPPALPQPGQQPGEPPLPAQPQAVAQPRQLPVPVSSTQALQQAGARSASSSGPAAGLLVLEEPSNELLDYLRCLDAASLAELTGSAGPEVSQAMDSFVARLMGTSDKDSLSRAGSDCSAQELAKVMFWLMVVGYSLRGMEVRWEVERSVSSGQQQAGGGGGGRAGWLGGWGGGGRDLGQDTW